MAKKQKWIVEIGNETRTIEYRAKTIFGGAKITVDGATYPIYSAKLFGESREPFMVGGEMGAIEIAHGGKATVYLSGEKIAEQN